MKKYLSFLFFVMWVGVFAQENFQIIADQQREIDFFKRPQQRSLSYAIQNDYSDSLSESHYQVVVHIIYDGEATKRGDISDEKVAEMITELNEGFAGNGFEGNIDTKLRFHLAKLNPYCNATSGINRVDGSGVQNYSSIGADLTGGTNILALKALSQWPASEYLNIWIVTDINGAAAFGTVPTSMNSLTDDNFGSVIIYDNLGNITHEVGHNFGLYHTDMRCDPSVFALFSECAARKMHSIADAYLIAWQQIPVCFPDHYYDVGIDSFPHFKNEICAGDHEFELQVGNYGKANISSFTATIKNGNQTLVSKGFYGLSFNNGESIKVKFPSINLSEGIYNLTYEVSLPNGVLDQFNSNDTVPKDLIVAPTHALNHIINFESGLGDVIVINNGFANYSQDQTIEGNSTNTLMLEGHDDLGTAPYTGFATDEGKLEVKFCYAKPSYSTGGLIYDIKTGFGSSNRWWIKANQKKVVNAVRLLKDSDWSTDTIDLSGSEEAIFISFYADPRLWKDYSNGGDFVALDNIRFSELDESPLSLDFEAVDRFICTDSAELFSGGSVIFTPKVTGHPMPVKYEWYFESAFPRKIETKFDVNPVYWTWGSFDVKLVVTLPDGSQDSIVKEDFVWTKPMTEYSNQDIDNNTDFIFTTTNDYANWKKTNKAGAYGESDESLLLNIMDWPYTIGIEEAVVLPPLNLSALNTDTLSFDYAYSNRFSGSDTLKIEYSIDCSYTWTELDRVPVDNMQTAPDEWRFDSIFVPTADQWKTFKVDLSCLTNHENIRFRIIAYTGRRIGNALYLDNIRFNTKNTSQPTGDFSMVGNLWNSGEDSTICTENPTVNSKLHLYNENTYLGCYMTNGVGEFSFNNLPNGVYYILPDDSEISNSTSYITIQDESKSGLDLTNSENSVSICNVPGPCDHNPIYSLDTVKFQIIWDDSVFQQTTSPFLVELVDPAGKVGGRFMYANDRRYGWYNTVEVGDEFTIRVKSEQSDLWSRYWTTYSDSSYSLGSADFKTIKCNNNETFKVYLKRRPTSTGSYNISGTFLEKDGNSLTCSETPVANVKIILMNENHRAVTYAQTGGSGEYRFYNIGNGDYYIIADYLLEDRGTYIIPDPLKVTVKDGNIENLDLMDGINTVRFCDFSTVNSEQIALQNIGVEAKNHSITFSNGKLGTQVRLYSIHGVLLNSFTIRSDNETFKLNNLSTGVYLIQLGKNSAAISKNIFIK